MRGNRSRRAAEGLQVGARDCRRLHVAKIRAGFHVSAFGSENVLAALSACSKFGFEAIELFADTTMIFADRPGEFRDILDISGVDLAGIHSGGTLTAPEFHAAE